MARLKFDLQPLSREGGLHRTREENDAWVRGLWAKWGRSGEPAPCDCGFWSDGWLVLCGDRADCRENVQKRLEGNARREHERGLAAKRKFPGPAHDGKGVGWCRWCGSEIIDPKSGARSKRRTWCAHGRCLHAYYLHTDHNAQRRHLAKRDGPGCKTCGAQVYGEVDHFIALAVAWEAFRDDPRWRWFFSVAQCRLLCSECHRAKTREDLALLKQVRGMGAEWAKAEVLRRLADAGLIAIARPKGATREDRVLCGGRAG